MLISLVFSLGLYHVTAQEVEQGIRRQSGPIGQIIRARDLDLLQDFLLEQDAAVHIAQNRLRNNLILINISIFLSGGMLSYYFARRTLRPIEEAHEAQSQFTADASHELRTPITAMRIETELSLSDPALTLEQAKEQLVSNLEELDKLTYISDGLLKLARLDSTADQLEVVKLSSLFKSALSRVAPLAKQKEIIIETDPLPAVELNAHKQNLIETCVILLDNAIKYSPPQSTVQLKIRLTKNTVTISIIDKGIGIAAADLPHIFDRFYRADQSRNKNRSDGYGIGLSIAHSIIQAHNGSISVQSKPEKGSTFKIVLPRRSKIQQKLI